MITFMMCALLGMLCGWWRSRGLSPGWHGLSIRFGLGSGDRVTQVSSMLGVCIVPKLNLTIELVMASA